MTKVDEEWQAWRDWAIQCLEACSPRCGCIWREMSNDSLRYWMTMLVQEGWRWQLMKQLKEKKAVEA